MTSHQETSVARPEVDPIVQELILARKARGYSQQNLADMAGISRRALAAIETGGNCTLSTLRQLAAALEVELQVAGNKESSMPTLDELDEENRRERFGRERGQ